MAARILIVEDDPVSRELIATLLASRGHAVDSVDDGFGALRMAQETPYDLVFVDYHLPEMDGYALARLMRSLGEIAHSGLKMVAITADRFGLASRRGVDSLFDRVLAKPIEPDALFALVDEFLGAPVAIDDLEAFLAPESQAGPEADAQSAGQMLWRSRGVENLPTAVVYPRPSPSEEASLAHCFRLIDGGVPDCLVLMRAEGLPEIEKIRQSGAAFLQPLVVIDPRLGSLADAVFEVGNGDSWTALAAMLASFKARHASLKPGVTVAADVDTRLLAYLFVAERSLEMRRDGNGGTVVPYTAGFPVRTLIESVKRLAARGDVYAKLEVSPTDGTRHIIVSLTQTGMLAVSATALKGLSIGF